MEAIFIVYILTFLLLYKVSMETDTVTKDYFKDYFINISCIYLGNGIIFDIAMKLNSCHGMENCN